MSYRKQLPLFLALVSLAVPFVLTHAASGQLRGKVTDPKGSVIAGASVTAASSTNGQKFAATDDEGRYKFANLPAGVYLITIKAPGFSDARLGGVAIKEDKALTLDVELEVAPVEGLVPASPK